MYWLKNSFYIIIGGLMLIFGCNTDSGSENGLRPDDSFSIAYLVDSIFSSGKQDSIQRKVTKIITVDDRSPEEKELSDYNIKSDLGEIAGFDFSSLRWYEGYELEVRDSSGLKIHEYSTGDKKAPADRVKVVYGPGGEVLEMIISEEKRSLVSQQNFDIRWKTGSGYSIFKESDLLFKAPSIFELRVNY